MYYIIFRMLPIPSKWTIEGLPGFQFFLFNLHFLNFFLEKLSFKQLVCQETPSDFTLLIEWFYIIQINHISCERW